MQELQILLKELELTAKGKVDPETLERLKARIEAINKLLDPTPKPLDPRQDIRIAVAALQKAQAEVERAEVEAQLARA